MNQISLSQLCNILDNVLSTNTGTYWVHAEIASVTVRGGHCYLDLVENASGGLMAKIRATIWAHTFALLRPYFEQQTGNSLQAGMQILVEVEVNFHTIYGLSLNITNIDPSYTVGNLAKQRMETIQRLKQEGVIDMNKALTLPTITKRLAVISSESAAGYEDFCNQLEQGAYQFTTTLFGAIMQGEKAAQSIIAALDTIAQQEEEWDAVVIIRGGGATTDLACFDDYTLCNHCAQFPLPIITGIGHTRDVSVLDMVAFAPLKTPTAVAQFFVDSRTMQQQRLSDLQQRLRITAQKQVLVRKQNLSDLQLRFHHATQQFLILQKHQLELCKQQINLHSPERIYKMGYSLVKINGKIVHNATELQKGDTITTHFIDGEKQSIVL